MAEFPRPVDDPLPQKWLEEFAGQIHQLIHCFNALERFREMVRTWAATVAQNQLPWQGKAIDKDSSSFDLEQQLEATRTSLTFPLPARGLTLPIAAV